MLRDAAGHAMAGCLLYELLCCGNLESFLIGRWLGLDPTTKCCRTGDVGLLQGTPCGECLSNDVGCFAAPCVAMVTIASRDRSLLRTFLNALHNVELLSHHSLDEAP